MQKQAAPPPQKGLQMEHIAIKVQTFKLAVASVILSVFSAVQKTDVSFGLSVIVSLLAIIHYLIKIKKDVGENNKG